ncbi:hypothetical protein OHAE_2438 [Ochrobactrum soli]|uniref:Uncharacterized protein n=1 Tax=Ochrobactrum soli TaxID=2448455 RepID=A0A2P9HR55_9HYPH|nr:hypothetical protein OHAE_2438 [[Ochrobactrum] soli]
MRWKDRFEPRETKIVPVAERRGAKCDFFVKWVVAASGSPAKPGFLCRRFRQIQAK